MKSTLYKKTNSMPWLFNLLRHPNRTPRGRLVTIGSVSIVAGIFFAYLDTTEGFSSNSREPISHPLLKIFGSSLSYTTLTPINLSNLHKSGILLIDRPKFVKMFSSNPAAIESSTSGTIVLSWNELQGQVGKTAVGTALNNEVQLRLDGKGSAHVQNTLRKFGSDSDPQITLYRDHAGW
jgi:hypothetical protein